MIIPDINILVYAHDAHSPRHLVAKKWVENAFVGNEVVGLPPVVLLGFVRLLSNPKVVQNPVSPVELISRVEEWLDLPSCRVVGPGMRHFSIMKELFSQSGAAGGLTTDIHLAALALEHRATLVSNDTDFHRFKDLKVLNPLS